MRYACSLYIDFYASRLPGRDGRRASQAFTQFENGQAPSRKVRDSVPQTSIALTL